jgi:hypothetical protein
MSECILYSFVTHVLIFFLVLGLRVPLGLHLAAGSCISSFSGVRVTFLYSPVRRPPLLLTLGAVIEYGRAFFGVTFFSKELPSCPIDSVFKPIDRAVRTQDLLFPPHQADDTLLSLSLKAFI